jgi:predicted MFS family arabinose efflux permease
MLVPAAELQHAQGLRAAIGQAAVLAGPAIGGLLLIASTPSVAILANAATFVASAAAIAAIPTSEALRGARGQTTGAPSLLADIRAGARALRGTPVVVRVVAADLLCSGVYGLLTVTFVLVSRKLGAAGTGYGIMLAGLGAGGVIGAIISARATDPSQWRRTLTLALLLVSVALPALGDAPNLADATGLAVLAGGGMVVGEVLSETALPQMLNDELLGSAYGLVLPTSLAGIVAGSLVGGTLVSQLGLQGALTMAGLFVLLSAAVLLRHPLDATHDAPTKRLRSLEAADARP